MGTTCDDGTGGATGLTTVRSRGGGVSVTCTPAGLPVELRSEPAHCRRPAHVLAAEILALCRLAGTAAGVRRRDALAADGVPAETLALLGLPGRDELVAAEHAVDARTPR